MPKFKSLGAMQTWLEKNVHQVVNHSAELERVLADAMVDSVWKYVYDAYEPESYNRREDEGGLADSRNYAITSVTLDSGGRIKLIFENLTLGNDSLSHTFLTDTIEEGIEANWNRTGEWSEARPFVAETAKQLRENPEGILRAMRNGLIAKGMKIRN